MTKTIKYILKAVLVLLSLIHLGTLYSFQNTLEDKLQDIDDEFSGNIGIYVKDLGK